ncbi:hypothetical protein KDI_29550 [Dictyobacter arantiisoli]|uniref:Uncharacterized protein n=1 Tax=Dictyobacter arantiisoli TaxID=2014874 RepID=A0A5A5TCZ4_9CHLR|nr:hypothetical protein [Dictyobacter arantiisoli]GCF09391.1 hypothetical protein KDI_29550 [Dictyobacter arantiisoli]
MRHEYGDHIYDGVAGENILIETDQTYQLAALGSHLIIKNAQTQQLLYLSELSVAEPCLEFSTFALHREEVPASADIKQTLQFLSHGRRGFYARQLEASAAKHFIYCGDEVFLEEDAREDSL